MNKPITLEITDLNDYTIHHGRLTRQDGAKFIARYFLDDKEVGSEKELFNKIVIGDKNSSSGMNISGSNFSMSGNNISINGMSISSYGNKLSITTNKKNISVEVNGVVYSPVTSTESTPTDEPGIFNIDFKEKDIVIEAILLSGSGSVDIISSGIFKNLLSVHIKGSGDINLLKFDLPTVSLHVMGSGDITCSSSTFGTCSAQVMGSGDISFRDSTTVNTMIASIIGSGDISGGGMIVQSLNKTSTGSGDISGFKKA
jgi:hypothetical protein